jgi:hypothetical protein
MAYSFIHDVPIDEAQYAEVRTAIGDDTPKGLVAHLVIRREAGLRYIDVWDSEEDWTRFRDERVRPAVSEMLAKHGIEPADRGDDRRPIEVVDAWVVPQS